MQAEWLELTGGAQPSDSYSIAADGDGGGQASRLTSVVRVQGIGYRCQVPLGSRYVLSSPCAVQVLAPKNTCSLPLHLLGLQSTATRNSTQQRTGFHVLLGLQDSPNFRVIRRLLVKRRCRVSHDFFLAPPCNKNEHD